MNTIVKRNFKQKTAIIEKIAMEYKKIKYLGENSLLICEEEANYLKEKKDLSYFNDLKTKIDYILFQMDEELSKIIYNEFFSSKSGNWWIYYYSKSTFYRLKNKAMDLFLEWWYA